MSFEPARQKYRTLRFATLTLLSIAILVSILYGLALWRQHQARKTIAHGAKLVAWEIEIWQQHFYQSNLRYTPHRAEIFQPRIKEGYSIRLDTLGGGYRITTDHLASATRCTYTVAPNTALRYGAFRCEFRSPERPWHAHYRARPVPAKEPPPSKSNSVPAPPST